MKTALLIGGTAATGAPIANELRSRGYAVTVYHRGTHELDALLDLEHIHGDPHQPEAIRRDLAGRGWDVAIATYGRVRHLAQELRGRTGHFVSVSGMPVVGMVPGVPAREDHPHESREHAPVGLRGLLPRIAETEREVLAAHARGDFAATVVRYPYVYGPHSIVPLEWHVIRRVLDRRRRWIVQGDGLALTGRCAAPNAARLIGRVIDQPRVAGGQVYHAADARQYSVREWVEMVAQVLGWSFEFVDIPAAIAAIGSSCIPMAAEHSWTRWTDVAAGRLRHALVSSDKARAELGYVDAVDPASWIATTVAHWMATPPSVGQPGDYLGPLDFDYAAEDRVLAFWDQVRAQAPQAGTRVVRPHPYDHPAQRQPEAVH
ncbi:MAG TPA: hypothetical protein VLK85_28575 [Ramlibacter sp.]|nr:hypothetical protein [Ramlibacter sp.]